MRWQVIVAAAGVGLFAVCAQAADPSGVMGKWIERFPNGKGMVTEFAPASIAFYPVDNVGKPEGPVHKDPVTFKDLGGDSIAVQFGGAGAGGIMLQRESADSLIMDFPGLGAHKMIRLAR